MLTTSKELSKFNNTKTDNPIQYGERLEQFTREDKQMRNTQIKTRNNISH